MKRISVLLLLGLAGCSTDLHTSGQQDTATETVTTIAPGSLFQREVVLGYLNAHPETPKEANDLFMQGVDKYRNEKDAAAALLLFEQSLLKHPTARAYYEYGNACMDAGKYRQSLDAYAMGEQLGFEPLSRLLYNTACAYSKLEVSDTAMQYLEFAIEAGYTDGDQILKDADLAHARTAYNFQTVYQSAMGGASDPEVVLWHAFYREFPPARFPLVLNMETEKGINTEKYISYDFEKYVPEMKGERFSRDVGKEFFYLAKVSHSDAYTAVVYAIRNSMMGENAPYAYMLASFDKKGKLIDKMVAGGREDIGRPYVVATIRQNLSIERKEYKETFEKDPEEEGYYNNKVISSELQSTEHYQIAADGHIRKESHALGMR